jgi:hypothetical protein
MAADLPAVTFRAERVGGGVADAIACPRDAVTARPRIVLLIHGFNVDLEGGKERYKRFVDRLREMLAIQRDGPVADDRLVAVYWPGDADWGFAKPLAYMRSVPRARDIGEKLARLLVDAAATRPLTEVDIVAHSLGCRLALETLRALHANASSRVHVRHLQLMAAAVPTFMLFDPDESPRLREAFETTLEIGAKNLWSGSDAVLSYAFPPGQTLAGDGEGFLPTALGHAKFPANAEIERIDPIEFPGAGHGSYWGGDYPDYSAASAYIAHEFLGLPDAVQRMAPERTITERRIDDAPPPPTRVTPARETAAIC